MIGNLNISNEEKRQLNDWVNFFSFKPTWAFNQLMHWDSFVCCLFTGNQSMKTSGAAMYNVMSILGLLPVKEKNINPEDQIRILRFASDTLPSDTTGNEVRNTQYPEFKKWLPPSLIKKDITARNAVMTIRCPRGGPDILVEFTSFAQGEEGQRGHQRRRVWIDEHCSRGFYEEQIPRLLAARGDFIVTLTPAQEYLDWEFDEFYERAEKIIRTPAVIQRIKLRQGIDVEPIEFTDKRSGVWIIMAATDDNPVLDHQTIENMYMLYGDEDIVDIRRYGLFKQISGKIFKQFQKQIHVLDFEKWFPVELPAAWIHARSIDYHEHNNWAIVWAALSREDEVFIYDEWYPSPTSMVTYQIVMDMCKRYDHNYVLNLIDPLAAKAQSNTGHSVVEDINEYMQMLRREEIIHSYRSFETFDTKSQAGIDEIRMRLSNAAICKTPFNNRQLVNGREVRLPTMWIDRKCRNTVESFSQWRKEEWASREASITKDSKDAAQAKWSHFPNAIEGIFKSPVFDVRRFNSFIPHDRKHRMPYANYMRG
jgi:phage terminase large subunit-like protein